MAMVYVTHNLGVVAAVCDRVGVMYAGELVEDAPVRELFSHPRHPYTRGLIDAVPSVAAPHRSRDIVLRGLLKRSELPKGCRFAPRCDFAEEACFEQRQVLQPVARGARGGVPPRRRGRAAHRRSRLGRRATSRSSRRPTSRCSTSPTSRSPTTGRRRLESCAAAAARGRPGRHVRPARARDVLARRRVGQRQVDDRAHRRRPAAAALRPAHVRGPRPGRDRRIADEGGPARDPARAPEPGRLAQSAPARAPDRGPAARALLRAARQGPAGRSREGARGRAARRGLRQPLSRRALGRRAAADRDCPRARGEAAADAVRRDPVRPGRVGADEHRRAAAGAAGGAGDRLPVHLARPRGRPRALAPRRRALPGRAVRGRQRRGRLRPAVPPLHAHAALGRARDRRREHDLHRPFAATRASPRRGPRARARSPTAARGRSAPSATRSTRRGRRPSNGHMLRCHIPLDELVTPRRRVGRAGRLAPGSEGPAA